MWDLPIVGGPSIKDCLSKVVLANDSGTEFVKD